MNLFSTQPEPINQMDTMAYGALSAKREATFVELAENEALIKEKK